MANGGVGGRILIQDRSQDEKIASKLAIFSSWLDWQDDGFASLRLDFTSLGANLGLVSFRIKQIQNKTPSESSSDSGWAKLSRL